MSDHILPISVLISHLLVVEHTYAHCLWIRPVTLMISIIPSGAFPYDHANHLPGLQAQHTR